MSKKQENSVFSKNKWVISVSITAVLIMTAIIVYFSMFSPESENDHSKKPSETENVQEETTITDAARQLEVASDAQAGENNSEIKNEMNPEGISGRYIDDSDGWYHEFTYSPTEEYDGTFNAGFDPSHPSTSESAQTDSTFSGTWKLSDGEIKLFSETGYLYSIFTCGEYLVDAQNYFVGEIPGEDEPFMSAFICKAGESGDTQILSFYPDEKCIFEVIKNDGVNDEQSEENPQSIMNAGTYEKNDEKLTVTINGVSQEYYILEDGLAKWIYHKM